MQSKPVWTWLGPLFVIIGAALWGLETYFRVSLNQHFDSEILVFHEHLFCIAFTLPVFVGALILHLTQKNSQWGKTLTAISWRSWIYLILSGAVGSAIGTFFFTLSLRTLNPSVANVLLNFQPLISVTFAWLLLQEHPGRKFFLWAIVALLAGLAIALSDFQSGGPVFSVGLVYITLTAIAWGFGTVAGRGAMLEIPLSVATLGRFVAGALTLWISLTLKGKFTPELLHWSEVQVMARDFISLSLFTGVVPLFFYFKGLQKTTASVGAFCELTQTFAALILTWGIMGNPLSPVQVVAGLVLMAAVYRVNQAHAQANTGLRT